MALKKRKKISSKKLRVDKTGDSADGPEKDGGSNGSDSAGTPPAKPPARGGSGGGGDGSGKSGGSGKGDGSGKSGPGKTREAGGFAGYQQFLKEVYIEYRKITWPDRQQITKETMSVLVLVTFITFLVLGYDLALGKIFGYIEHLSRIYAGG